MGPKEDIRGAPTAMILWDLTVTPFVVIDLVSGIGGDGNLHFQET